MQNNYNTMDAAAQTLTVSFQCTDREAQKLNATAATKNISISELAGEYVRKSLNSRKRRYKKKLPAQVELQQKMNEIINSLQPEQKEIREQLKQYSKEAMQLWDD